MKHLLLTILCLVATNLCAIGFKTMELGEKGMVPKDPQECLKRCTAKGEPTEKCQGLCTTAWF